MVVDVVVGGKVVVVEEVVDVDPTVEEVVEDWPVSADEQAVRIKQAANSLATVVSIDRMLWPESL